VSEHTDSVNRVASWLSELVAKNPKAVNVTAWKKYHDILVAARNHIALLEAKTTALPQTFGDLSDLPDEVRAELNLPEGDELESQITTVVNAYGGTADINQIIIGLYRKFKVTQKRRFLQNKLYRMIRNDMLWSVPDRKGLYTTTAVEGGKPDLTDEEEETPARPGRSTPPKAASRGVLQDFDNDFSRGGDFDDEIPF